MTVSLEQLSRCSVAVDLGASRMRVYVKRAGLVVDEPNLAAVDLRTGRIIAIGSMAERMSGRTPAHISIVHPVVSGVVVDTHIAQRMLRHLLHGRLPRLWRGKPSWRAAMCVPFGAEPLVRQAATETVTGIGARRVELVSAPIAAAIGSGLPVDQPEAAMIVICGAATTQVAVLSLGEIVAAETVPVGGDAIDRSVIAHMRHRHQLMLSGQAMRPLRVSLGGAGGPELTEVQGKDVTTGLARSVAVDTEGIRLAMLTPLAAVLDSIGGVLRRCPPDLVVDLADRGVMLAGGSARLPGFDDMLREATGMPVHVAEDPGRCAVRGLGMMLEGALRTGEPRPLPEPEAEPEPEPEPASTAP